MIDRDDIDPRDALDLDPDWTHVPPELKALDDGSQVIVGGDPPATLLVAPALFAHARRLRERAAGDDA